LAAALAATAVIAAAAGWLLRPSPTAEPGVVARFSLPLPSDHTVAPTGMIAVSPDGTRVVYAADDRLYLRDLAETEARAISGTEERIAVTQPVFSPDGQWIAYVHVGSESGPYTIKRIHVSGGAPIPVYVAETVSKFPYGLSWPTADTLLFATADGVTTSPANGGAAKVLIPAAFGEGLFSPQLLPGGDSVLFTRLAAGARSDFDPYDRAEVVVQSIGREDRKVVWTGGSAARYLPSGHLVFAQGRTLFAIAYDREARVVRGGAVSVAQNLARSVNGLSDTANFGVSDTGTLAHLSGVLPTNSRVESAAPRIETTIAWVDRNGREEPIPVRPDDYTMARLSPDGTRVALVIGAGLGRTTRPSIWIYDFRTENLSLLTTEPAITDGPVWSSDGNRIWFRAYRLGQQGQMIGGDVHSIELATGEVALVGAGTDRFLVTMPWALAPDGQSLAVINARGLEDVNLATLSLGTREFADLLAGAGQQSEPSFSPDGAWMASSDAPSAVGVDEEINVRAFPAVARTRIPVGRGQQPVFSRDGSELFFYDGRGIAAAPISYTPALRIGAPRRLFESNDYLWGQYGRAWDPDASGQRFLMIRAPLTPESAAAAVPIAEAGPSPHIDVVVNWFEELKRRVPVALR
jgi:serine/threonine-protein kinase